MSEAEKQPIDHSRVSISEDEEVRFWAEIFGITNKELLDAVKAAGTNEAEAVEEYICNR